MKDFSVIVACTPSNGIGINGTLPWRLRTDMAFFKAVTTWFGRLSSEDPQAGSHNVSTTGTNNKEQEEQGEEQGGEQGEEQGETPPNAVIMGRKTWESIPPKFRPLDQRINVVLSRSSAFAENFTQSNNTTISKSLEAALEYLNTSHTKTTHHFIIGGTQIYQQALQHPNCKRVFMTRIQNEFECDAFFPLLEDGWRCLDQCETGRLLSGFLCGDGDDGKGENGKGFEFKLGKQVEKDIQFEFLVYERSK